LPEGRAETSWAPSAIQFTFSIMMMMTMMMIIIIITIIIDYYVLKNEAEKILKYKDLTTEIQRMWNVKAMVIPVVIGATGTISKSFRKYVRNIRGSRDVKELQKTAVLGTAHILRKVLT
jgi:heme/copper-type cytochrome/quinol oxidase subunit 2